MTEETEAFVRPKRSDLIKFAREGEAITVRNKVKSITVFVAKIDGVDEQSEFQAYGDPNGNDVLELPSVYLKNANFRTALKRKILEIVDADDPDVLDAFEAQNRAWDAQQAAKEESDRMVALQSPRAFSGIQCLAQEGRAQCSEFAISSKVSERPPLCSKHAHLSHQYAPEETGKFIDGKPEVQWRRVTLHS